MHIAGMRERNTAGGGPLDAISAFRRFVDLACFLPRKLSVPSFRRFNWKLDGTTDPLLRKLCHKDLRFLVARFVLAPCCPSQPTYRLRADTF